MKAAGVLGSFICVAQVVAASRSAVTIDAQGNIWRTGQNLQAPLTPNAFQKTVAATPCGTQQLSPFSMPTAITCSHGYVTKQDAAGNILYATYLGGSSEDGGIAITTDMEGNAYVTGFTYSQDFPVTARVVQPKNAGPTTPQLVIESLGPFGPAAVVPGGDVFVTKFAPDGTLLYSTLLGGSASDVPSAIYADMSGSAYITGTTKSTDFPVTKDAMSHQNQAATFLARLDPQAASLVYSTYSDSTIHDFDVDSMGDALLTGLETSGSNSGPYVTEIATETGQLVYSTYLPEFDAKYVGEGAVIRASGASQVWVGVSPAPVASPTLIPAPPVYPLGPSFLLEVTAGGQVLRETDLSSTQLNLVLQDAAGDVYASGLALGALPPATATPLLATPCSTAGGEFVLEVAVDGNVAAATYLRQGTGEAAVVTAPGQLSMFDRYSGTAVATDLISTPVLNFGCLQNLASGSVGLGIAQGEIFALSGSNIGPAQTVIGSPGTSGLFPTTLSGVQVTIGGIPAPLLLVQSSLIEGVAPFEFSPQPLIVQVQYGGRSAPPLELVGVLNPGIFTIHGQAAVLNQDGTVNSPTNPAKLGSIISVFATGLGPLTNPVMDGEITPLPPAAYNLIQFPPTATVAGVPGNVIWAGSAPGLIAGGSQINMQLPASLPAGTDLSAVPLLLIEAPIFSLPAPISVTQ